MYYGGLNSGNWREWTLWLDRSRNFRAPENLQLVRRMAEPLSRFDRSSIKSVSGKQSDPALAASEGSGYLYQKEGLTVAIWGSPVFRESHCNQLALSGGIAKTLADQWRGPTHRHFLGSGRRILNLYPG